MSWRILSPINIGLIGHIVHYAPLFRLQNLLKNMQKLLNLIFYHYSRTRPQRATAYLLFVTFQLLPLGRNV
ncbi:MAG: hypothetical protein PUI06_06690 [Prevotella sp.]|nr:hypothetical protein [Prevotella sp.]